MNLVIHDIHKIRYRIKFDPVVFSFSRNLTRVGDGASSDRGSNNSPGLYS